MTPVHRKAAVTHAGHGLTGKARLRLRRHDRHRFGIAENFAKHGANVSVASRKRATVDAATAALGTAGGNIVDVAADVRDSDAVGRAFDSAASQLGTINVGASAAGNFAVAVNAESSNGFRPVVDVDLIGTFNVMPVR